MDSDDDKDDYDDDDGDIIPFPSTSQWSAESSHFSPSYPPLKFTLFH